MEHSVVTNSAVTVREKTRKDQGKIGEIHLKKSGLNPAI